MKYMVAVVIILLLLLLLLLLLKIKGNKRQQRQTTSITSDYSKLHENMADEKNESLVPAERVELSTASPEHKKIDREKVKNRLGGLQ